jgi:hypothetical protein
MSGRSVVGNRPGDAVHRAGDRLRCVFALTRGGGRHERATTGGSADLSEFQATRRERCGDGVVVALSGGGKLLAAP